MRGQRWAVGKIGVIHPNVLSDNDKFLLVAALVAAFSIANLILFWGLANHPNILFDRPRLKLQVLHYWMVVAYTFRRYRIVDDIEIS
jgi:hypothetical protein